MNEHTPVALITGCSSGIGRATAILLAEKGWRVFATARRLEAVNDLASDHITPLRLDVTDEDSMATAVDKVLAQAGRIDALVNNAGYGHYGPLEEMTTDEIHRQFETNAFGPLRLVQLVAPAMRSQGNGRIVNVSSVGGRMVFPFLGLYNASKFALEAMSDALRLELHPFGIRVIVVEPGTVRTGFADVAARRAQRFLNRPDSPYRPFLEQAIALYERFMTGRLAAHPEFVAAVIHRALTARRPRARYAGSFDASLLLPIARLLPDGMRDAILGRALGL